MKYPQSLESYLDELGHTSKVIDALDYFASRRNLDSGKLFEEFAKYRMVSNNVTSRTGQLSYSKKTVELHEELLRPGREANRDHTLLHETAHLIIGLIYPESLFRHSSTKSHGPEWKAVMRHMGCRTDRCGSHDFMQDVYKAKAKLMYACKRCEHEFPAMRRKKHAPDNYKHKGCGGGLYLKSERGRSYPNPAKAAA